jgi:hypothetical protein
VRALREIKYAGAIDQVLSHRHLPPERHYQEAAAVSSIQAIHLGFEVGSGKAVEIPCRHMVVTGQTQEAGKTTTLEALISRSGLPAVAFVTKRGEQSFRTGPSGRAPIRRIPPYFRERADWQFVASVLEATMRERLKFERAWIMRASKGAKTLADVQENVQDQPGCVLRAG